MAKTKRVNRKPKPGVYEDIPFDVYASWPYVNNSLLNHATRSAAHFREARDNPKYQDTPSMRFGRLVDAIASNDLRTVGVISGAEWLDLKNRYSRPTSTRQWDYMAGKIRKNQCVVDVYTEDEVFAANRIWKLVVDGPAGRLVDGAKRQVCLVWDDPTTGIRCKARLDFLGMVGVVDLKTSYDVSQFRMSILRFGYHRQMAFYRRGWSLVGDGELHATHLIAAETREPFGNMAAPLSARLIAKGEEEIDVALARIARAVDKEQWDGYASPQEWDIPVGETVTVWIDGEEREW